MLHTTKKRKRANKKRSRKYIKAGGGEGDEPAHALTNFLADRLRAMFNELVFEVEYDLTEDNPKQHYDFIRGLACENKEKCECFALKVYYYPDAYVLIDRIRYKYGEECRLSGSIILEKLTRTFKDNNISPVFLYDVAKINIEVDGAPKQFSLSTYNILLHGVSWYNKYGYINHKHAEEMAINNMEANKAISSQLLAKINEALDGVYVVPKTTTFREFAQIVDDTRRNHSLPPEIKNNFMRAYLVVNDYFMKNKTKLKYDFYLRLAL